MTPLTVTYPVNVIASCWYLMMCTVFIKERSASPLSDITSDRKRLVINVVAIFSDLVQDL
jgi:hypothetical protein